MSLDSLPSGVADAVDVHSQRVDLEPEALLPFGASLRPEEFILDQTF